MVEKHRCAILTDDNRTRFLLQRNDRFDKMESWKFRDEVGHSPFFFSSPSMEYLRRDAKWLV